MPHEIANPASDGDPEAFCEEPAASVTGAFIAGSAAREQGHADGSNSSAHNSTDLPVISSIAPAVDDGIECYNPVLEKRRVSPLTVDPAERKGDRVLACQPPPQDFAACQFEPKLRLEWQVLEWWDLTVHPGRDQDGGQQECNEPGDPEPHLLTVAGLLPNGSGLS
ncbi:MAG: hypothetical protein OEW06_12445, partial [Gemmatimonadota bacterium]|nr:hypothetical protein [Gemmatimonadota bacterium]